MIVHLNAQVKGCAVHLNRQLGERLKALRKDAGWSQTQAAEVAGVRREMWAKYEAGAEPGATPLAALAAAGFDVLYILTGQRSGSAAPAPVLSEGDRILLDNFHAAPAQVQAGIKTTLGAFAPAANLARKRPPKAG